MARLRIFTTASVILSGTLRKRGRTDAPLPLRLPGQLPTQCPANCPLLAAHLGVCVCACERVGGCVSLLKIPPLLHAIRVSLIKLLARRELS